ncbi:hypothetical protein FNV43_RR05024 [Rhamnella rubrinervis]|uniref:Calmodulin-binding protein n=1 Tax=Rhamnella rubrinervis TaxID=2594499 RepID=A0A8K0HKM1_9ROSA|nr:hypothetical protein FNV43_RR05024 [Rhamnella rubrinervis]
MVPKRHLRDAGGDDFSVPFRDFKRRSVLKTAVGDAIRNLSVNEAVWETFLRRVVRDEVEHTVFSYLNTPRPSFQPAETSGNRHLQLHFVNKMPTSIFTGSRIEAEDATPIKLVLKDASSQATVNSGPLSSIKVEILALNGDFGSDGSEDWTEKQFYDSVVRERDGKRPLVTGDLTIQFTEGVGYIGDVSFTDNSSWIRSRKFRLGARVLEKNSSGESRQVRIREARSEAFVVKDHRGESYRKHHPPSLDDEIWRLEKIAKDGASHKKLSSYGIETVKDFLRWYMRDPSSLRNIFGGISDKNWNTIIRHAMDCDVNDNKLYTYHGAGQEVGLLFNSIYKVVGAIFNDRYCSLEELSPSQKILVENLKQYAYKNVHDLVTMDELAIVGLPMPLASLQVEPFNDPNLHHLQQHIDFAQQDQPMLQLFSQSTTPAYSCEAECSNQMVTSVAQNYHPMQVFNPTLRDSFSLADLVSTYTEGEPSWCSSGSQGAIVTSGHLSPTSTDTFYHFHTSTFPPTPTAWGPSNGFLFASGTDDAETGIFTPLHSFVHISSERKPKAGWCKIRAAVKWWLSVRQLAAKRMAARRMPRSWYLDY